MAKRCPCTHYLIPQGDVYSFSQDCCHSFSKRPLIGSLSTLINKVKSRGCIERLQLYLLSMHDMPSDLPDCKQLILKTNELIYLGDFPDAVLRIPSLEELEVGTTIVFKRIPPSLRAKFNRLVCEETPYWLMNPRSFVPCIVVGKGATWQHDLLSLYVPILHGLQCQGPWKRWLTEGLYDPRLFALIRDFLL